MDSYEPEQDVEAAKGGDRDAKERILFHMTGAVKLIARKYVGRYPHLAYDDLVQEGHMAVLRCVRRWTPGRGTKFSTYAYQAIRNRAWIIARRTKVLLQLDDEMAENDGLAGLVAGAGSGRERALEIFKGLGWDRCRVLLARVRPVIEGRGPRPWATIAKMEGIPARRCRELYAEAVEMVRKAHGEDGEPEGD